MHTAVGHSRAVRALLIAVLVIVAALGLLPRLASAQDPCPVLQPDCDTTTTSDAPPTSRQTSTSRATSTTDDDGTTGTTDRSSDDGTTTTRAASRTTQREQVTTSTLTVSTLHDVLIPGDGTAGSESTTTEPAEVASGGSGLSDGSLIAIVVAGLGVVALVAAVLTWRYWTATRPRLAEAPPPRRAGAPGRSVFLD